MKRFFRLFALGAFLLFLPFLVWGVKPAGLPNVWLAHNNVEGSEGRSGSEFFFNTLKSNVAQASLKDAAFSFDEVKDFDAIYVATQDGYGITADDWNKVNINIAQNAPSLLFAEYGTIHNTESAAVSATISESLGVNSANWSGLFVEDLSDTENPDIPQRIYDRLQDGWAFSGPGIILNNNNLGKSIVLELGGQVNDGIFSLEATEYGKSLGFESTHAGYRGWFDVVTPASGTQVLYHYALDVTESNKALLREHGLPEQFAAVTHLNNGLSNRFYLTGTFSHNTNPPGIHQFQGVFRLHGVIERYGENGFYWNSFFPFMRSAVSYHSKWQQSLSWEPANEHAPRSAATFYPARINAESDRIEVLVDGKFSPVTMKGVNIGMAKPGYFPGEAAISEDEYYSWFEMIGAMNANTVRVYTLHPPDFYRALARYNATHEAKIYVLHGVWINEEWITGDADAFHKEAVEGFQTEITHVVDALHGNIIVEPQPGHSSGVYATDVSDYIIGWVLGTEWDPFMVQGTNEKHADIGQFVGEYYETENASPFEYWLASQMEFTTQYEMEHYNEVRPMSFTNWVTTDILHHPSDSSNQEDISEVNPNHIHTRGVMKDVGQFASYHVYPYYPDFIQRDQKYVTQKDHRGEINPYYAYLKELRSVHNMPVLVAEYGVPSSRGRTHSGPNGMHQGMVTEHDQGVYLQSMFEDILETNYMGGLIFTWQDEWFKRTWNTMDFDNPDRRPYWSNAQTSEQQFGLLSFDNLKYKVDGDDSDWNVEPFYSAEAESTPIEKVFVDHDETYLYFKLNFRDALPSSEFPVILLDTIGSQGNRRLNDYGASSADAIDFAIQMKRDRSQVLVDSYYDMHAYLYGFVYGFIDSPPNLLNKNSGQFTAIKYVLNQAMMNPETGESTPFEEYETGLLREGNANPDSPEYDSLADYAWSADGTVLELRVPWLLLNFRDPSQKEVTSDFVKSGDIYKGETIESIGVGFLQMSDGKVTQSFPANADGASLPVLSRYQWADWNTVEGTPRLKQSYYVMQKYFATVE